MKDKSEVCLEKLQKWIEEGGGLICGATPWGFLQIYSSKTLEQLPLNFVLRRIGMAYTDGYLWQAQQEGFLSVAENKAQNANFYKAIVEAKSDNQNLVSCGKNIASALEYLPDSVVDELIPEITVMIQHYASTVHCIPTKSLPVSTPEGKILTSMINRIFIRTGQYNGCSIADGISEFPGQFETSSILPETVTQKVT